MQVTKAAAACDGCGTDEDAQRATCAHLLHESGIVMIIEIIRHTPVWVFFILVGLVYLGARRIRSSEIPAPQLVALPIAMACFSLFGLWQTFGSSVVAAAGWAFVFAALLIAGWSLPTNPGVQYSAASRRIRVPGSWIPLALMMTIFFLRYAVAVLLAMHPSLRIETPFVAAIGAVYGLSSGCFAARALITWHSAFSERASSSRFAAQA
jgi:hypothetical protein